MRMHNLRRRIDKDAQAEAKRITVVRINGIVSSLTKMFKPRREKAFANGSIRRRCNKLGLSPSLISRTNS